MENNLFKDAKFGDLFLTRSGKKAVYVGNCGVEDYNNIVLVEGERRIEYVRDDGMVNFEGADTNRDIISKL